MSDQFNEQELQALFQKHLPNDPMPPGLAASLEQRVLAEVASVLKPEAMFSSAHESEVAPQPELARQPHAIHPVRKEAQPSFLARVFGQMGSFQFGPSLAMMGTAAAVIMVLLNFNTEFRSSLTNVFNEPQTSSSGAVATAEMEVLEIEEPTAVATDTTEPVEMTVLEPTPTPVVESAGVEDAIDGTVVEEATAEPVIDEPTLAESSVNPVEEAGTELEQSTTISDTQSVEPATEEITSTEESNGADNSGASALDDSGVTTATRSNGPNTDGSADNQPNVEEAAVTILLEPTATATTRSVAQAVGTATARPESTIATSTATTQTVPRSTKATPTATIEQPKNTPTATATPTNTATHTATATNTPKPTDTRTPAPTTRVVSPTVAATTTQNINTATTEPNNTPVTATNTPLPTNTAVPATNTPLPTNTAVPATNTPIIMNTTVPATNTPMIMNTTVPATNTPVTMNTTVPATNTPSPTNTTVPTDTDTPSPADTATTVPTNTSVPATNTPIPTNTPVPTDTNTPIPPTPSNTAIPQAANQRPQVVDDIATINEDEPLTLNALANDSDADSDPLTLINVGQPSNGTVTHEANGQVVYTPAENYFGDDAFTYEVSDNKGPVSIGFVRITINAVNDLPMVESSAQTINEDSEKVTISILENVRDVENDTITLVEPLSAAHGTVSIADNMVEYTPNADYAGTDTITYHVSDGDQTVDGTITIDITPVNDAPLAVADTIQTNEDTSVGYDLRANDTDIDAGATLIISSVGISADAEINIINGGTAIEFTPNQDFFGTGVFTYTITDGESTASADVNYNVVAVNDEPVANDDVATTPEDTVVSINPLANDSDIDTALSALTIVNTTDVQNGTVAQVNGALEFTPEKDYNGPAGFNYTLSDGELTAVGAVAITITAVNDTPIANADVATTPEDTVITINPLANDSDDNDGSTLTVTTITDVQHGTVAQVAGTWEFTPEKDYNGPAGFNYILSDGELTAVGAVAITITAVNDAPIANDDIVSANEDTPVSINPLANDDDIDNDVSTFTIVDFTDGQHGTVTKEDNGALKFTPEKDYYGPDGFSYTMSDGELTAVGTVVITITAVNDDPILLSNNSYTLTANSYIDIPILAPSLVSDVDGDTLSASIVTPPEHAEANISDETGTWMLNYTPDIDYSGTDSLTYRVSDGQGGTLDVEQAFVVTNQPPAQAVRTIEIDEDTSVDNLNLLEGATDPEDDTLSIVYIDQTTAHGTVTTDTIEGSALYTYTPNINFFGEDVLHYSISDGKNPAVPATLNIKVNRVNFAPTNLTLNRTIIDGKTVIYDIRFDDQDAYDTHEINVTLSEELQNSIVSHSLIDDNTSDKYAELQIVLGEAAEVSGNVQIQVIDSGEEAIGDSFPIAIAVTPLTTTPEETPVPSATATSIPPPTVIPTTTVTTTTTITVGVGITGTETISDTTQ